MLERPKHCRIQAPLLQPEIFEQVNNRFVLRMFRGNTTVSDLVRQEKIPRSKYGRREMPSQRKNQYRENENSAESSTWKTGYFRDDGPPVPKCPIAVIDSMTLLRVSLSIDGR